MTATSLKMSSAVLLDSGPLYALADPSDHYHQRARRQLEQLTSEGRVAAVAYPTLAEAYTLVLRRLGTAYAHHWLREVLEGALPLNPEPRDYQAAFALLRRFRDKPVTLFDAVTASLGARLRMPVWTYDRHFALLGAERW